ncbi:MULTISPECIES: hypothetical protein [Paracoccus]|uniref:hypothetical protein n=1 Tax=Paracoccus TaxID=265 RepID=UPI000882E2E2|nr:MULTISPECIES: hypothetical protein [Paracoccus]MBB4628285.1 hypothetical protein [Paracoccus denitrificans]MCU7429340.1 hypothetical protein [Paracoccus denitrificans]MDK8873328.1 hypothetical protein [Paracoccus sp. SSJ]UPV97476.1 hypothetical protein M0K93_15520 [Paracoccus denitrificans]SDI88093.1 hypothetical protein SAMN04244581_02610 [Paracoccus denitrificans]
MSNLFWLTDAQMERLKPFFSKTPAWVPMRRTNHHARLLLASHRIVIFIQA